MKTKKYICGSTLGGQAVALCGLLGFVSLMLIKESSYFLLWSIPFVFATFMTLLEETSFNYTTNQYRFGNLVWWVYPTGKWKSITENCYLKIEPKSEGKGTYAGIVKMGVSHKMFTVLYFINPKEQDKFMLCKGDYNTIKDQGVKLANDLNLRLKDYRQG